ncbi:MAG: 50S ribosomal protein L24 [Actinobacteria bacterium]|jgi:large subunit ribosomal protein L24|nr:50S ribosomal protein L24 [Actinomycetota bacterium]
MKFRKGDTVQLISGKEAGSQGEIIEVRPKDNQVIVQGRNIVKRHTKARSANQKADIIEKPMPIDASNVMLVVKGKPTRVGYKIKDDGTKVRVAKKTGDEV